MAVKIYTYTTNNRLGQCSDLEVALNVCLLEWLYLAAEDMVHLQIDARLVSHRLAHHGQSQNRRLCAAAHGGNPKGSTQRLGEVAEARVA